MHCCYLLLGSNLGKKKDIMTQALSAIESEIGAIQNKSGIYTTEPWGFDSKNEFLNMVVRVSTQHSPGQVLENIHKIESRFGRIRNTEPGYVSRTLDIDILFYDDLMLETAGLVIPHPRLHERRFALEPLAEIAQEMLHPVFQKSIAELLCECKDDLKVQKTT